MTHFLFSVSRHIIGPSHTGLSHIQFDKNQSPWDAKQQVIKPKLKGTITQTALHQKKNKNKYSYQSFKEEGWLPECCRDILRQMASLWEIFWQKHFEMSGRYFQISFFWDLKWDLRTEDKEDLKCAWCKQTSPEMLVLKWQIIVYGIILSVKYRFKKYTVHISHYCRTVLKNGCINGTRLLLCYLY